MMLLLRSPLVSNPLKGVEFRTALKELRDTVKENKLIDHVGADLMAAVDKVPLLDSVPYISFIP
jgi:hypothetical protein